MSRTWIYLPGDSIVKRGDTCKELFYLRKGRVRIVDSTHNKDEFLEEGNTFNEYPFIFNSIVLKSVIAEDFCIMDVLAKDQFDEILSARPDLVRDVKVALKQSKSHQPSNLYTTLQGIPFFSEFRSKELRYLFEEYLEVIYLNPKTLITSPSSKCNALYFILQGKVNRYANTDLNLEFIRKNIQGSEDQASDEFETFVQQVDSNEKKKQLEEAIPSTVFGAGDFLGSSIE